MTTVIGIDTSNNKEYSGVVIGSQYEINRVYAEIHKILKSHGKGGIIHWRKIPDRIRKTIKTEVLNAFSESKISFYVFEHKKPHKAEKRKFYLIQIPNTIASYLEHKLRRIYGTVVIEVDDDYTVSNVQNSTEKFIESLLRQLSFRLAGCNVPIRYDGKLRSTVKLLDGTLINFIAVKSKREISNSVCLADFAIGFYLYNKSCELTNKRIHFKKI